MSIPTITLNNGVVMPQAASVSSRCRTTRPRLP